MENEMTCKDLFLAFCEKAGIIAEESGDKVEGTLFKLSFDCKENKAVIAWGDAWFEFDKNGKLIEMFAN